MLEIVVLPSSLLLASAHESALRPLLVQLVVIILAARLGAVVARRCGQPSVVGEIVAGLLLGPSALGAVAPELSAMIFQGGAMGLAEKGIKTLNASLMSLSQIGLILLLFLIGLEFDFSHIRRQGRLALAISMAGIAAPFALGIGLAIVMVSRIEALGATVIAAAACDDAVGWTLLAAVSAIAVGEFEVWSVIRMIGASAIFAALAIFAIRPIVLPLLERAISVPTTADRHTHSQESHGRLSLGSLSLLLAGLLLAALITSLIGIFAIFGAFLLGAALSGSARVREAISAPLSDFVTIFFLPIFFTYTGLRTNIGSLGSLEAWLWCGAVMAAAVLGKWGGCGLAARLCGMPTGEASCVGVLMNTRALMELIVINVGMDLGVIPPAIYCMLVLMAIGTTLMATPLAAWMLRGSPYEGRLIERGFLHP